jgi:hypothetical protein
VNVTIAIILVVLLGLTWVVAEIQGRRCHPVYVDECETCGRKLTAAEVRELRSDPDDEVEAEFRGMGGTYMSAVYCPEHYPKES